MSTEPQANIKPTIEAALLAAGRALSVDQLCDLFVTMRNDEDIATQERRAVRKVVKQALQDLGKNCESRGIELLEVASGYRYQVRLEQAPMVAHLWAERPARQSRAMLETLALIAYRQPITRGDIEKVRGVSVSTYIVKNLLDYGWIRIVGHRHTAGHPRLYGTTAAFLDHFSLKQLNELPPLADLHEQALAEEHALQDNNLPPPEHDEDIETRLPDQLPDKNVLMAELPPLSLTSSEHESSKQDVAIDNQPHVTALSDENLQLSSGSDQDENQALADTRLLNLTSSDMLAEHSGNEFDKPDI